MNKNLFAFFLASLLVSFFFVGFALLSSVALSPRPVQVEIKSDLDVHDIVAAVESVHRQDVDIHTLKSSKPYVSVLGLPMMALVLMFITGLVLSAYKWVCLRMGIEPTI